MRQAKLTLLYDGGCPICAWEKRKLARSDKRGRLGFVNIQSPDFDPSMYGVLMQDLKRRLHAVTADGRLIKGPETLLQSYRAVVQLGFNLIVLFNSFNLIKDPKQAHVFII